MKYHTVYRTINLSNGKFYIGYHGTRCLTDRYLGSGIYIQRAIKKYGRRVFKKEIIFTSSNESEAHRKEVEFIQSFCHDPLCMNYAATGRNGKMPDDFGARIANAKRGKKRPVHVGLAVAAANRKRVGWHHSEEVREKISKSNIRAEAWRIRKSWNTGLCLSKETRKLISEAAKLRVGSKNPSFGKVCIHSKATGKRKRVHPDDLEKWINQGWILGLGPRSPR